MEDADDDIKPQYTPEEIFIEERITVFLLLLKITPNLKGYSYLKCAIKKILENRAYKRNMSNGLYEVMAKEFGISKNLIDRSMRHAILVGCKRGGIEYFELRTGYSFSNERPTPREMICTLVEILTVEMYEGTKKMAKKLKA